MKRAALAPILMFAVLLPVPVAAQPVIGADGPLHIVRAIRDLQDSIALGKRNDVSSPRAFIADAAQKLSAQNAEAWREPRNAQAVLLFCMSGGDPKILRTILSSGPISGVDEAVVRGVLAYAEGRDEDARSELVGIDARDLSPVIGAHVALVQGVVFAEKDRAKARIFFDRARLLAPESAVEEAALRREVPMLAAMGDLEASYRLASRYFRRYGQSVFARSFRTQFANDVARRPETNEAAARARLADILENIPVPGRRELYLALANQSVVKGNIEMARFAAIRAARLAVDGSPESMRSKVYEAAALVVTDDYAEGVEALDTIDRARLAKRDAELADAASAVAAEVHRWPDADHGADAPASAKTEHTPDKATMDLVNRARSLITKVDMMNGNAK